MDRQCKYDAFISYRYTELDKFVAEKIHKYLESFKLPKNIRNFKGFGISYCYLFTTYKGICVVL